MPPTCLNREQKKSVYFGEKFAKNKAPRFLKVQKRRTGYVKIFNCNCDAQT